MRSRLVSALVLPTALLVAAFSLSATAFTPSAQAAVQNQAPVQNRIAGAVSNGSRVALPGTIGGHARNSTDLGLAPASLKLESLSLRFSMTAAQQADLNQLLAAQLDPSSPSYHQWLTSEQFGARFGLSSSDLANVSSWLTSQGFTITSVAKSSTFITFSGTVGQVQQAFGTTIHNVSHNGEQHIANLTDPTLPSAIASVTLAVTGLNDFKLKPRSRARNITTDSVQPGFTTTVGGVTSHYIAPGDLYTIYDYPPSSSNLTGTGITIAVMGATDLTTGSVLPDANLTAFRTAAGLPAINLKLQLAGTDPGVSTADIDEAHLDVEWSGASAPGATILYVYGSDVLANSLTSAIDASPTIAPIITISYGGCESGFGASFLATYNQLLQLANVKGITVMSSSGDDGATDCDTSGVATEGLTVDFPSSSPFVTSAGGTTFSGDVNNVSTYWNTGNAANNSSAKTYIPEQPWNETTASGALDAGGSGGGGASGFFSKPAWQTGLGVPNDSSRDLPDVSLNAAAQHDGYVVCSQGSCTNGFLASNGQANVFGGTSFVAPSLAGILALVEQKLGTGALGNIGPTLYGLANGSNPTSIFHTIQVGNNSVPCSQGTSNCPSGGSIGYSTTGSPGYNLATGLGSLDVNMLVTNWASAKPTGTGSAIGAVLSTTTVTTSTALCAVNSATLALNVTVATGSPTSNSSGIPTSGAVPTGTVQVLVDNVAVGAPQALVNGVAAISLSTSTISSGGHTISAVYSGDAAFAGSKGTLLAADGTAHPPFASVDFVSSTQKDFSITPCTGSVTVAAGATSTGVVFTITPANGFTGAVTMTAVNNNLGAFTPSFSVTPVNITSATGVTTSFIVKASQTTTAQLTQPRLTPFQRHPSGKAPWYAAGSGATLACMLLLTLPRRRRWAGLLAVVLSLAALTAAGCGGNTSTTGGSTGGGSTTTNAQRGTYTFTITAVSGTLVHSSRVTITVQ
jgi:hypothetical protein